MPQVFKIGSYLVYFWIHEGMPLEPIHVHVAEKVPIQNATKIWITRNGRCIVSNNASRIPERQLRIIMDVIEVRHKEIEKLWINKFGRITYYC
jgi:hypothetical protein